MQDPHQEITTQIYNDGAEQYKKSVQDFIFPGNMFEYFVQELSGKKILDVGCGFGRDVYKLRKLGYEAYGIDLSEKLLSISDEDTGDFLTLGDITQLQKYYDREVFDGIISSVSLVHLDKNIAQTVLSNIYSFLNNSGIFFLTLKVSESGEVIFKESTSLSGVQKKYVYYTQEEISNILENIGFTILKTHILETQNDNWMSIICKK